MQIKVRSAKVWDARGILELVNEHALDQVMLPRSPASIIENVRDFVVAELDGEFVGCGALHVTWTDIAEVRSVAVATQMKKGGVGRAIVDYLVQEAIDLGIPRLFAFTYVPGFFEKMGFRTIEHEQLPHKVFNDCMHCPKFQACDEVAMERVLDPEGHKESLFGLPQRRSIPLPRPTNRRQAAEAEPVSPPDDKLV